MLLYFQGDDLMSLIILKRTAVMLIYMLPGFILYKKHIITNGGAGDMGKLLICIILPSAILNSYNIEFSKEKALMLLISFPAAAAALLLSVIISRIFFKGKPIESFGAAFSNAGFMGIPLISSVIGEDMVYCAAAFVALLNILQWTYGVFLITGKRSAVSVKKIFLIPVMISFISGAALFFLPVRLPPFISEILGTVSQMNAPMAMMIIGFYMAQVSFKDLFAGKRGYAVSAVRLLIIPLMTTLLAAALPPGNYAFKLTMIILAAAPIGTNAAVYAQLYGGNYKAAAGEIVLSTLLSVVTMPLIIQNAGHILQNSPL